MEVQDPKIVVCTYIHTYIHTYTYIHSYIHVHTYIHTYTHTHEYHVAHEEKTSDKVIVLGICIFWIFNFVEARGDKMFPK